MAIGKPGKPTPLNKALLKTDRWCRRETKGMPMGSYSLCYRAQRVLLGAMAEEGMRIMKGKKVVAGPRSKKKHTK